MASQVQTQTNGNDREKPIEKANSEPNDEMDLYTTIVFEGSEGIDKSNSSKWYKLHSLCQYSRSPPSSGTGLCPYHACAIGVKQETDIRKMRTHKRYALLRLIDMELIMIRQRMNCIGKLSAEMIKVGNRIGVARVYHPTAQLISSHL